MIFEVRGSTSQEREEQRSERVETQPVDSRIDDQVPCYWAHYAKDASPKTVQKGAGRLGVCRLTDNIYPCCLSRARPCWATEWEV